jgi:MFS family permease
MSVGIRASARRLAQVVWPGRAAPPPAGDARPECRGTWHPLASSLSDRALRILVIATLINRIGRGVFLTVAVLYFTLILGLSAPQIALVLAAASGAGVLTSLAGGWLVDHVSARVLLIVFSSVGGIGLMGLAFAGNLATTVAVAVVVGAAEQGSNSTRTAIIARGFRGEHRMHARAALRITIYVGMAVGSGLGAIALLADTALAYRVILIAAGAVCLMGVLLLARLPHRVDPPKPSAHTAAIAVQRAAQHGPAGRRPWRDPRYLGLTALCAVFGMQFAVGELGVPLWIAHDTAAPQAVVAALLVLNTTVVVLFQMRLAHGAHHLRRAGRSVAIAAWLMAAACLVYGASAGLPVVFSVVVLLAAGLTQAFSEVLAQAGGWGLAFGLADPSRAGAFEGVFAMGFSMGAMLAPFFVTSTALTSGMAGWAVLAAVFLAAGLGVWAIARAASARDVSSRSRRACPPSAAHNP